MIAYMGYLVCQYNTLKLLQLMQIALMVAMFYLLAIVVTIQRIQ